MSWLILLALTSWALIASLSVVVRAEYAARGEAAVATLLSFYGILVTPVVTLGYTNLLWPVPLGAFSFALSSVVIGLSMRGASPRVHGKAVWALARALLRVPVDSMREAIGERSWAAALVFVSLASIACSAVLTYLAPSESWDGFFYHEPIVGFAIQNHGFVMVNLPRQMVLQGINSYPRFCEAFSLWFVIFTDKSLIEIGNTIAAPGLVMSIFVLASRQSARRVACMGWACVPLLAPAMLTQLRTSMLDVQAAFFLVAGVLFATRAQIRRADALYALLAVCLATNSKSSGLVWAPPILFVLFVRLILARRRLGVAQVAMLGLGGASVIAGSAALTFVRNWHSFHNPLWPVSLQIPRLGIDWPGIATLDQVTPTPPWREVLATKYGHPSEAISDLIERDYGYGIPWIVVPLALVAGLGLLWQFWTARRRPEGAEVVMSSRHGLLALAGLGIAFAVTTPSSSIARYNIHIVAILIVVVARFLEDTRWTRLQEGALAAIFVLSVLPWIWSGWFFGVDLGWHDVVALFQHSHRERGSMNVTTFGMPANVATMRDNELQRGDVVLFTAETFFPGVLWNQEMSNRVIHVPFGGDADTWLRQIDDRKAKWVVVGARSTARKVLDGHPEKFALVGPAARQDNTVAFRCLP